MIAPGTALRGTTGAAPGVLGLQDFVGGEVYSQGMDEIVGGGPCAACGADPARGFASVYENGVERWYCHPDDGPSCYASLGHLDLKLRMLADL